MVFISMQKPIQNPWKNPTISFESLKNLFLGSLTKNNTHHIFSLEPVSGSSREAAKGFKFKVQSSKSKNK